MAMLLEGRHLQFFVYKKQDPSSYFCGTYSDLWKDMVRAIHMSEIVFNKIVRKLHIANYNWITKKNLSKNSVIPYITLPILYHPH